MTLELLLCVLAIAVSIVVGYKLKVNTGLVAACFAFVIGTVVQSQSAAAVIASWPTNLTWFILICGMFFAFAMQNGTIDALANKLLYLLNGRSWLILWMIFLMGIILQFLGAGFPGWTLITMLAAPLATTAGLSPVAVVLAAGAGSTIGNNNPWTGAGGVVITNLIGSAGQMPDQAAELGMSVFLSRLFLEFVIALIVFLVTKAYKAKKVFVEKPEPFTPIQKKTLTLLVSCSAIIVAAAVLKMLFPASAVCAVIARAGQPQVIMTIGAVIAILMKVGPVKEAVKAVPIDSILMVTGFTMLMSVAQKAGMVDALAAILSQNIPDFLVKPLFVLVGGTMCFFCSGTAVVFPLLFPVVLPLSQATGMHPSTIFICITIGSLLASLSPFSSAGSLLIAGFPEEEVREKLSTQMIFVAIGGLIAIAIAAGLGVFDIFALGA